MKKSVINSEVESAKTVANSNKKSASKAKRVSKKQVKNEENIFEDAKAEIKDTKAEAEKNEKPRFINVSFKNNIWYVYILNFPSKEKNICCGCKSASSAIRFMMMIKRKYQAIITKSTYAKVHSAALTEVKA